MRRRTWLVAPEAGATPTAEELDPDRQARLLAADDVFRDVGGDVADFFFAQHAFERGHPATAVGHLFFGTGLRFGQRHRPEIRTAVTTVTGGAVADGAFFGEDFFAGCRVRRTARGGFAAFFFSGFRFFGLFAFFGRFVFLTRVFAAFFFGFQAFGFG